MVSTGAVWAAMNEGHLVKVLENKEADLYFAEDSVNTYGYNYNISLKKGEYIAISREEKFDAWTEGYFNSTKGSYDRCERAWEKYSPVTMGWMRAAAGVAE